jgi:hypothetical protein
VTREPLDLSGDNRIEALEERERQAAAMRRAKLIKDEIRDKLGQAKEAIVGGPKGPGQNSQPRTNSLHIGGVAFSQRTHYRASLEATAPTLYADVFEKISMLALTFVVILPVIAFTIACAVCWKWQRKLARLHEKIDRTRGEMSAGGDWRAYPRCSRNRVFDEYRTETLRLLEEEQREFRDFLDRLRHAKDKAEFDQFMAERFMAERRNRPLSRLRP